MFVGWDYEGSFNLEMCDLEEYYIVFMAMSENTEVANNLSNYLVNYWICIWSKLKRIGDVLKCLEMLELQAERWINNDFVT